MTKQSPITPPFLGQFDQFVAFGKDNAEAWIKSGNAAVAGIKAVADVLSDSTSRAIELGNVASRALLAVKSPAELQAVSASLAKAQFDATVADGQRLQSVASAAFTDSLAPLAARAEAVSSLWKVA